MDELDAMLHQDGIVFDWDPQLLPTPLRNRRVGEELEREEITLFPYTTLFRSDRKSVV